MLGQVSRSLKRSDLTEKCCGPVAVALGHLHSRKLFRLSQSNHSVHKIPADACRDTVNASALIED